MTAKTASAKDKAAKSGPADSPEPTGLSDARVRWDAEGDTGLSAGTCTAAGGERGGDVGSQAAAPAAPRYMLASASSLASRVLTAPLRPSCDTTMERRRRPPELAPAPAAARSLRRVMNEK